MHTEASTKDGDESLASRGLTIRSKLLLFTTGIGFLILAALAITAFFLSAIALRKSRLDGFQSPRTSLSQAVDTLFADQRRGVTPQSELQMDRGGVTDI